MLRGMDAVVKAARILSVTTIHQYAHPFGDAEHSPCGVLLGCTLIRNALFRSSE